MFYFRNIATLFVFSLLMGLYNICLGASTIPFESPKKATIIPVKILIKKEKRELLLIKKGKIYKTYKVALGFQPKGHKRCEGDGKTPEGLYSISGKYEKSSFHLALQISYPNKTDCAQAKKLKCSPGGLIMIHGLPKSFAYLGRMHVLSDWTLGCVAVTNPEIEEIWDNVPVGTPVEIVP